MLDETGHAGVDDAAERVKNRVVPLAAPAWHAWGRKMRRTDRR